MFLNCGFPSKQYFKRQNEAEDPTHTMYNNNFRTQGPRIDQVYLFYKFYHQESTYTVLNGNFLPKQDFKHQNEADGPAHTLYTQCSRIDQGHLVS